MPSTPEPAAWTGHASHWHYFWYWVLGILLAVVVVGLLIIAWICIDRARTRYTVTATKVIIEWGLVAKSSDEVRIRDIRSISVRKSGFAGLMGVGDLEFASAAADQAAITFKGIPKADDVRDLVRSYQDATST